MNIQTLIAQLQAQKRSAEDIALIERAYAFAAHAHQNQKRKSGEPYIIHPLGTAIHLATFNLDAETLAAALLHDVCEDTTYTFDDIKKEFGAPIAQLVEGVTKLDKIRYRGTERSAESLRKMFLAIAEDIRIVLLKLVDRLHNMQTLQYLPPEKQKRIALETLEIYAPLAYRLGIGQLKGQLEDLAFPYVHPKEYEWLMKSLKDQFESRRKYVEHLKPVISEELGNEHITCLDIHARAKHYYSLYKKLLKYEMDISKVFDLIAIRIIVSSIEDCYATLGVIHKLWRPLPGLVKDYIALPKPNGYRSLHTTVFAPEGRVVEFQIRTKEMHDEAENGIAAHWAYTEKKGTGSYARRESSFAQTRELQWIEQLREWQKDFDNPQEFLESIKIDFFKDRIFVLTPKGDVMDLPEGSTPIDFAYMVHSDIGNTATGARVNGKLVPLNFELKNRDVVEIIIQKSRKPNQDWLEFVKTAQARKRIGAFLRRSKEEKAFEKRGGEIVELRVTVRDRIGILRDVSNVLARNHVNMKSIVTETQNRLWPVLVILAPFKNKKDLESTMVRLKEIKGVDAIGYKLMN